MTQTTSEPGYVVIKTEEGRALRAYRDIVGVWTIGYGNTASDLETIRKVLGRPEFSIKAGVTVTDEEADKLLRLSVQHRYEPAVRRALPNVPQPVFDAGVSFHWNTGAISRATWVGKYKAGSMAAAKAAFLIWNKAAGKTVGGLTRRRQREWAMIERGDYGLNGPRGAIANVPGAVPANAPQTAQVALRGPGMLQFGDSGPAVKELQVTLAALGYKLAPIGQFDEDTQDAVKHFQSGHPQLTVDGKVGPATRAALLRTVSLGSNLKKKVGTAVLAEAGTVTVDQTAGAGIPWEVLAMGGVAVVAVAAWVLWKYRDEVSAWINAFAGKEVP